MNKYSTISTSHLLPSSEDSRANASRNRSSVSCTISTGTASPTQYQHKSLWDWIIRSLIIFRIEKRWVQTARRRSLRRLFERSRRAIHNSNRCKSRNRPSAAHTQPIDCGKESQREDRVLRRASQHGFRELRQTLCSQLFGAILRPELFGIVRGTNPFRRQRWNERGRCRCRDGPA